MGSSIGYVTAETITPNDDVTALSDRELLERIYAELADHGADIGGISARLTLLDPLVPLIPRVLALLDPGRSMRKLWRSDAVPKRPAAPVHVGEASEDRPPMGA